MKEERVSYSFSTIPDKLYKLKCYQISEHFSSALSYLQWLLAIIFESSNMLRAKCEIGETIYWENRVIQWLKTRVIFPYILLHHNDKITFYPVHCQLGNCNPKWALYPHEWKREQRIQPKEIANLAYQRKYSVQTHLVCSSARLRKTKISRQIKRTIEKKIIHLNIFLCCRYS